MTKEEHIYQMPLTPEQALLCIFALKPICHCRCRGILHGRRHDILFAGEDILFSELGEDGVPESLILKIAQGQDPYQVLREYNGYDIDETYVDDEFDNGEDEDENN